MKGIVLFADEPQKLVYFPEFFATSYFERLSLELPWQQNEIRVFGKIHPEPRLTCWFGPAYRYSSIQWEERSAPALIDEIQQHLMQATPFSFNAVMSACPMPMLVNKSAVL